MCGIVGVFPLKQKNLQVNPELVKLLALWFHNEILFQTVKRGKDATGIAVAMGSKLDEHGNPLPTFWAALKQAVDTEDFFNNDGHETKYNGQDEMANIKNFMNQVIGADRPFMHVIGHTRLKTVGSEYDPKNNHPILVGNIIGVHNGGVKNHKKIYEKHPNMKPIGEVDSEAIMQLIAENANDRPLDKEALDYVCERVEGPRAVMAYNSAHPSKVMFFRDFDRPIEGGYIKELGLLILCSEKEFLKAAMNSYQRLRLLREKEFPRLSLDSFVVASTEGGIIDLDREIDKDTHLKALVEVYTTKTMLNDYRQTYNNTSNNNTHNNGHTGTGTTFNDTTSPGAKKVHQIGAGNPKQSDLEDAVTTELHDHSEYTPAHPQGGTRYVDEESDANSGPGTEVPEDDLADEPGNNANEAYTELSLMPQSGQVEAEDAGEEEDPYSIPDEFDREYMQTIAERIVLDKDFYTKRPEYTIPKFRHAIDRLIPTHKLSNEERHEVLQAIYMPVFSDGVEEGFTEGWQHALGYETEDVAEKDKEIAQLRAEVEELQSAAYKATGHMANLKNFLIAALVCNDMIDVGPDDQILFDRNIEDFLQMSANGFSKVDAKRIRNLFTSRDKKRISQNLARMANQTTPNTKKA